MECSDSSRPFPGRFSSDDGLVGSAGDFVLGDTLVGATHYPGYYTFNPHFLVPTSAFALRQVQLAAKLLF